MSTKVTAVIPVRLDSKRFAGKVLFPVKGRPLVLHLLEDISKSRAITEIVVATDDEQIRRAVEESGYSVVMTTGKHKTGSDRVAEAVAGSDAEVVINVQGDNFGLSGRIIDRAVEGMLEDESVEFATLARRIKDPRELTDSNVVKVVMAANHDALWYSRLPIPFEKLPTSERLPGGVPYYAHIGVYIFRKKALEQFTSWPRTLAEKAESLEQLRILEHGGRMRVFITKARPVSVDSREDLRKIEALHK